jgi:hypothetical protein
LEEFIILNSSNFRFVGYVLKVVKIPMKKIYYYLFSPENYDSDPELHSLDPYALDQDDTFSDVYSYLDKQVFDVNKSVIQKIIEFAARQSRDL